jgi:hypothetical protein
MIDRATQRTAIGRAVVAVIAVLVIIVGTIGFVSLTQQSDSPTGGTSAFGNTSTQQNDFTLTGPVPLVTVTPGNNTFTLAYTASTLGSPVTTLSFSLSQSYVAIYTNGTEWVSYSQACSSGLESTSPSETVTGQASGYSVSVIAVPASPCNSPPAPGWVPVNGSAIDSYAKLNSSQVDLSVNPAATPANHTVSLQFTITLNLRRGIYVVGLALGVQTTNAYGWFFEYSDLNPFPVIVKS